MNTEVESFPRPKKWRSKDYLAFIRRQPCLYQGRRKWKHDWPSQAHHVRKWTDGGMALKPSDFYVVPLCQRCHRRAEEHPDELFEDFAPLFKQMVVLLGKFMAENGIG